MSGSDTRQRLLDAAIDHVSSSGMADLSLRGLADAIGTSHRMLIHHFGSKERLWVEIVRTVEERQRARFAAIAPEVGVDPGTAMRTWWRQISDPSLWPNVLLFFEVYGQALRGKPDTVALLDGIVEDWVEPAAALSIAAGMDPDLARAQARLGVAVTRGLLLDLLATGDRAAVDAAMDAFIDMYVAWLAATG